MCTTQPYHVGENVLVESKSGEMLWDATVTAVSVRMVNGSTKIIDAYRVEYKDWGRRFVEWVNPSRVVEPSENNLQLQVSPNLCGRLYISKESYSNFLKLFVTGGIF